MNTATDSASTLRLRGAQTLQTIAETHRALSEMLANSSAIAIDARKVTEADLTFVQLIESARRSAARDGKHFVMMSAPSKGMRDVLVRGGFLNSPANALFWSAP